MERITSAQPPPCTPKHPAMDIVDMQGRDYPMYVYKPRRGMKRGDDSKETYKLPHRLIEKKRRDRINECIAQLKDLLPEHLKLTTLGHLEKAVVLELTLKHVKALSSVLEQQQQKIMALQNGLQIGDQEDEAAENSEMFRSGFHLCAKEVLQYVANQESSRDLTAAHIVGHIHKVASELLDHPVSPRTGEAARKSSEKPVKAVGQAAQVSEGHAMNCVPVIQRTFPHGMGELSGSDTDTDSGYGGEHEKLDSRSQRPMCHAKEEGQRSKKMAGTVKRESDEPKAKRSRSESSEDDCLSVQAVGGSGSYVSFSPNQPPFCVPFYLIPPAAAAAAAYLPMLEKCWHSGGMPIMYPGMSVSASSLPPEGLSSSLGMSPRSGSPSPNQSPMESPALLQALRQIPSLNLETKD